MLRGMSLGYTGNDNSDLLYVITVHTLSAVLILESVAVLQSDLAVSNVGQHKQNR